MSGRETSIAVVDNAVSIVMTGGHLINTAADRMAGNISACVEIIGTAELIIRELLQLISMRIISLDKVGHKLSVLA